MLATRNAHKVAELRRILADAGLDVDLHRAPTRSPDLPDVAETGTTFADNALLKARAVAAATGLPAVADDSGLCVDVLGGMPGVFSARWSGRHGDDAANLDLLLAQLADVPDDRRAAHFACAAALGAARRAPERVVEGRLAGSLVRAAARQQRVRLRPDLRAGRRDPDHGRADAGREGRDQPPRPGPAHARPGRP